MTHSGAPQGWTNVGTGRTFGGVPALFLAGLMLLWKVVSLQWLWMRWKNKAEARSELRRLVGEHEGLEYAYWVVRVGQEKRVEFTTQAGTWYQASIEAVWDGEPGGAIRVLFSLDDGGPSSLFPMTDSLLVEGAASAPE